MGDRSRWWLVTGRCSAVRGEKAVSSWLLTDTTAGGDGVVRQSVGVGECGGE